MKRLDILVLAAAMATAGVQNLAAQAALFQRPTDVTAVIAGTSNQFDGTYTSAQVSRLCGETDPTQSFSGVRAFIVEFPADLASNARITDVRFDSKTLVGQVGETGSFFVSVTVVTAAGGRYPALVIDTQRPAPGHTGTATLAVTSGTARLTVKAKDDLGRSLDLNLTCRPSQP